jgi:lactate dehydrogenase-like 2-hydroxyacid dehydrogenase
MRVFVTRFIPEAGLALLRKEADMETNPKLLGIADYAVGYNNIDVETATQLGIPVTNTPRVLTDTTADLAWALILSVARNIVQGHPYVKEGRFKIWSPKLFLGTDVSPGGSGKPKTLGIIGFGVCLRPELRPRVHRRTYQRFLIKGFFPKSLLA